MTPEQRTARRVALQYAIRLILSMQEQNGRDGLPGAAAFDHECAVEIKKMLVELKR